MAEVLPEHGMLRQCCHKHRIAQPYRCTLTASTYLQNHSDKPDFVISLLQHNMPFWRITNHADLVSLHQALELDFL